MSKGTDQQIATQQDFGTDDILNNVELSQENSAANAALLETSISSPQLRPELQQEAPCKDRTAKRMVSTPSLEGMKLETELRQVSSTKWLAAAKVTRKVVVSAPQSTNSVFDRLITWLATQIRLFVEKFLLMLGKQPQKAQRKSPTIRLEDPDCDAVLIELQTRRKRKIRRPMTHHFG